MHAKLGCGTLLILSPLLVQIWLILEVKMLCFGMLCWHMSLL